MNIMKKQKSVLTGIVAILLFFPVRSQDVGTIAPGFTVDLLGGEQFTLSEHSGKVVLVYFFGNGCPYCISAGPDVEGIYQEYQSNTDFVAVGLDTWNSSSNEASVGGFAASAEITFPLAIKAGSVATDYGTTYDRLAVIGRDGILRHKGSAAAANDIDNTRGVIEGLLRTTSVDQSSRGTSGFTVYPNPASEELRFSFYASERGTSGIILYDIAGNEVFTRFYEHQVGKQEFTLDLSAQQSGLYLYRIFQEGKVNTGSFILQK